MPAPHTAPPGSPPTASASPKNAGLPEYTQGARLVAFASAPLSQRKVVLTWTPKTLDIVYSSRCDGVPEGITLDSRMDFNSPRYWSTGGCLGEGRFTNSKQAWIDFGAQVGKPATISFTVLKAETYRHDGGQLTQAPVPIPTQGRISVAIYERIPFEDYPLPPRLSQLVQIDPAMGCFPDSYRAEYFAREQIQVVRSDPDEPLKPMMLKVEWRDNLRYHYRS